MDERPAPAHAKPAAKPRNINVQTLNIQALGESNVSQATEVASARESAEKSAREKVLAEEIQKSLEQAKQYRITMVKSLLGVNRDALITLRLLSGGSATQETISTLMNAEMRNIDREIIPQDEKREKMLKIQAHYDKLLTFAQTREAEAKKNILKMKKSKNPVQQAIGFDIDIAVKSASARRYQAEIDHYNTLIELHSKSGSKPLSREDLVSYQLKIKKLTKSKDELTKELDGEEGKDGLRKQRENIKGSKDIPNIVEGLSVALTPAEGEAMPDGAKADGTIVATEIEAAKNDPIGYIENIAAYALTSEEGIIILRDRLVRVGLIGQKDVARFNVYMELGLSAEEKRAMALKTGGKGLLGLSGILGLLAYLSWKKSMEGGQPQMG